MSAKKLAEHRACFACGYNLQGLQSDGACPECGLRIAFTLDHDDVGNLDAETARWELEQRRQSAQLDAWDSQARRVEKQLDSVDKQNERWDSVLSRVESLLDQFEAIADFVDQKRT